MLVQQCATMSFLQMENKMRLTAERETMENYSFSLSFSGTRMQVID